MRPSCRARFASIDRPPRAFAGRGLGGRFAWREVTRIREEKRSRTDRDRERKIGGGPFLHQPVARFPPPPLDHVASGAVGVEELDGPVSRTPAVANPSRSAALFPNLIRLQRMITNRKYNRRNVFASGSDVLYPSAALLPSSKIGGVRQESSAFHSEKRSPLPRCDALWALNP